MNVVIDSEGSHVFTMQKDTAYPIFRSVEVSFPGIATMPAGSVYLYSPTSETAIMRQYFRAQSVPGTWRVSYTPGGVIGVQNDPLWLLVYPYSPQPTKMRISVDFDYLGS